MIHKIIVIIGLLYFTAFANIQAQSYSPVANEKAVVKTKNARFTVLTPELIRMEWDRDGVFEDKASLVFLIRSLPVPEFKVEQTEDLLIIKTTALSLQYKINGSKFNSENLSVEYLLVNERKTWRPGMENPGNLGGTARTLDGCIGGHDWNGNPVDLGEGLLSRDGWALVDDSKTHLFDGSDWNWVENRIDTTAIDWYFFGHGLNYKKALYDYTQIAGKIPMIPRYAFGYWWSRYWVYSDQELKTLMQTFRSFDIPIDVLVIDMDWHETFGGLKDPHNPKMDETGHWLGWTGYTWNRALFPDPPKFLEWTRKNNLKTALNLHPASGIAPMEESYEAFAEKLNFDTTGQRYIHYQMANKEWAQTYFKIVLQPMEEYGVDFWWLDWQQYPESKIVDGLSNTWWLNYTFYTDMQLRGQKRPLLFHRWGGLGNHRYQIGFSGDDRIDWGSLKYQTYFTATASNVGYGYWSHDIGGHASSPLDRDPELYVRWLQFGVFSPILRTHSAKMASIERRFWKYPDHFAMMKDLVHLRYSLAPYIYTASWQTYNTGVSLCRPMYYDYPESDNAYQYKYQYMFSENMLVAPIAHEIDSSSMLAEQTLWLPEGEWFEWHTGSLINGGKEIIRDFALNEIPLYVKAGSIIPMYPKINHLQDDVNEYILSIVPGQKGKTVLYEDDGDTEEYKNNQFATTQIESLETEELYSITIFPTRGTYSGKPETKKYEIRLLRSFPPQSVLINGKPLEQSDNTTGWHYNGHNLSTHIVLPEMKDDAEIAIIVTKNNKFKNKEYLLNNKTGKFKRLAKVMEDMKLEVARGNWWALMPDLVLAVDQTPVNIDYNPESIVSLLESFEANLPLVKDELLNHPDGRKEKVEVFVNFLELE